MKELIDGKAYDAFFTQEYCVYTLPCCQFSFEYTGEIRKDLPMKIEVIRGRVGCQVEIIWSTDISTQTWQGKLVAVEADLRADLRKEEEYNLRVGSLFWRYQNQSWKRVRQSQLFKIVLTGNWSVQDGILVYTEAKPSEQKGIWIRTITIFPADNPSNTEE